SAVLNNPNSLVAFTLLKEADARNEATQVVSTIQEIINNHPNDTIAILVKARTHLQSIIPKLREANLNHQAFELETLRENMVIRDLFSLTRSLFNLTDRIAWIAILRAPWCGLDLEDLYKTVRGESPIIWENICNHQNLDLSKDGESRLIRLKSALIPIFTERGRITWRELIEKAWLRIGGPATVTTESELEHAQAYLELLNDPLDIEALQKKLDSLYTPSTATTANIQLMTIHKSKGLEFDHVIIPGINRPTRFENHKLMLWFERPKLHHGSSLILAPITASGSNSDHVYQYLQLVEQKKITYETGRLLYVAMTRAKKSIHLIGCIKDNKENFIRNSILSGTLLEQLKPCFNEDWDIKDAQKTGLSDTTKELPPKISRLGSDWQLPITLNTPSFNNTPYFELIDNQPSIIGTIIHHCFRQISESKLNDWNENHIINQHPYWRKLLQQLGYLDLEHGLKLINEALTKTLKDERGRWILTQHQDAKSELAITAKINHKFVNYIIDRTFIDDGIRWIIDYKTSRPDEESIQDFQNQEADQYSKQLLQYANAMQSLDPKHKIRLGLYFPLFSGWIEIKPSSRSGGAKL
ncbi:MAG: PD-(D/E)XK nuclease family protein, partial [Gammaproteobacteria bacterium]|nr:PD-(D/E)XK nuclease family protein [Gammaproteobacteria bacterium]